MPQSNRKPKIPPDNGMPINTERMLGMILVGMSAAIAIWILITIVSWWQD